jgi:hypothetical protein
MEKTGILPRPHLLKPGRRGDDRPSAASVKLGNFLAPVGARHPPPARLRFLGILSPLAQQS